MLPVAHWPSVSWADEVFPLLGQPSPWLPVALQTFSAQVSLLSVLWNGSPAVVWVTPALPFPSAYRGSAVKIRVTSFRANVKACSRTDMPVVNFWHYRLGHRGKHNFWWEPRVKGACVVAVRKLVWWDWITHKHLKLCKVTRGNFGSKQKARAGQCFPWLSHLCCNCCVLSLCLTATNLSDITESKCSHASMAGLSLWSESHSSDNKTVCPHAAFLELCLVIFPPLLKMSTNVNQSSWQACGAGRWYSHFKDGEAKCESWHKKHGMPTPPSPCLLRSLDHIALRYTPRAPAQPWCQEELHTRRESQVDCVL